MKTILLFLVVLNLTPIGCVSGGPLLSFGRVVVDSPHEPNSGVPSEQPTSDGTQGGPQGGVSGGQIQLFQIQTMGSGATVMASANFSGAAAVGSFSVMRLRSEKFETMDRPKLSKTASLLKAGSE